MGDLIDKLTSPNAQKIMNKIIQDLNLTLMNEEYTSPPMIMEGLVDNPNYNSIEEDYISQTQTYNISFIEFAILNSYFHSCFKGNHKEMKITSYGQVDNVGRIHFGGLFEMTGAFWFNGTIEGEDNEFIFQTTMFKEEGNKLVIQLNITMKTGVVQSKFADLYEKITSLAFNNSEYKGKCIKVKLYEGHFKGIEIVDVGVSGNRLILNETQRKFIEHFINRVKRGGNARCLMNGDPGTGKTESIREIGRRLMPISTFIIPEFATSDDLGEILEACEIFINGVIIMDDIDLYLGSRENGSYTRLLGQFLAFFDGVKKRNISLLASTNDKGLVDKAAERPGRFNFTIDYTFLSDEDIVEVCNIHLPKEYQIQEVYDALCGKIGGKKANITGAFISNLADNIKEMSIDNEGWCVEDTIMLITETYKGFYTSQVERNKQHMGFEVK